MTKKLFTLHLTAGADPDATPMVTVISQEGVGFLVGQRAAAEALYAVLDRYLKTGRHDELLDPRVERLVWQWLKIEDAVKLSEQLDRPVGALTIRAARRQRMPDFVLALSTVIIGAVSFPAKRLAHAHGSCSPLAEEGR